MTEAGGAISVSVIDETHDPALRSWVESANGHADFPIQNLPFGIFSDGGNAPRSGVAIGEQIIDLAAVSQAGLLSGDAAIAAQAARAATLNAVMGLPAELRRALRRALSALLAAGAPDRKRVEQFLYSADQCTMHMPARIGDFTDFFAGIHHATNAGRLFRPDNPLLPNYKYVPVGYHGRSSSIRASGGVVRRPSGQRKIKGDQPPLFSPTEKLDYELELGIWIGPGNELGERIAITEANTHIAGFCLLNDWSARDIQAWEYQPLGPFLAKNFGTTISPWIVTMDALEPFRSAPLPRPADDPPPLPHLHSATDQAGGALDITLEVLLSTRAMTAAKLPPHRLSRVSSRQLYWTPAQLIAHHTSGGCNLEPGDLFGSGTISGTTPDSWGSLLEITEGGRKPLALPSGETRTFLEDGDEIVMRAKAMRDGFVSIGLGECRARIAP
jgi:fumarylacetoacetase